MDNEKKSGNARAALQGLAIFTAFCIISRLTHGIILFSKLSGKGESLLSDLPTILLYITSLCGTVLIFSTVANTVSTFDKKECDEYLAVKHSYVVFWRDIFDILRSRSFILQAAVSVPLVAISSLLGAFPEVGGSFFIDGAHRSGFFPFAVLTPLCFLILLFSKYEARRYWHSLYMRRELDKLGTAHFILRVALTVILYPVVFPYAPLLGFMAFTLIRIIAEITELFTVIGTLLIVIVAILLFLGISYLSAMSKRRKFLKRLIKISEKSGYELSKIAMPYCSFFKNDCRESFTLHRGSEIYECTLISTLHKKTPLIFTSPTDAYFRHRLGTRKHHISLNHHINFYPAGEGKQVLIINPSVKYLYVTDGVSTKEMIGSDRIFGFTVYDDVNFLGAVERGHIGRV